MEADKSKVQQNANLLASRGQYDKAIAEWKKLLADSPTDGTIHNNIGDLHVKRNAVSEAVEAYFQAGTAFQASGSALKAIAVYKKILKIDPSRYKVYQSLGDLNAERGLVNNAVSDYAMLSKVLLKEGLVRDALAVYRKIVNLDPTNLDAKRRFADLALQEGLRDEAVKILLQLGKECSAQNRPNEAREAYHKVLNIDPGNTSAERWLANPHEALREDRPSRSADSTSISGEIDRGQALEQAGRQMTAGQYSEAEALLSELLSSHPGDPEVCRLLAMLHIKRGELAVALSEIQFLAEAAIRAEDYTLAESMVVEYLKADPKCVALLDLLGNLFEQSGNQDGAVIQYGKAIEALIEQPDPEMPSHQVELYEKIIRLAPKSPLVARFATVVASESAPAASAPPPPSAVSDPFRAPSVDPPTREASTPRSEPPSPKAEPSGKSSEQEYRTHYDLGVAYKDMGLFDEAIEEFRVTLHGHDCFSEASSMLSMCLKDKDQMKEAIECLETAIADARCAGDKSTALRYELGVMCETEGLVDKAADIFLTIPNFLDVPVRLERLRNPAGKKTAPVSEPVAFEPEPAAPAVHQATVSAGNATTPERKKRRISYL